MSSSAEPPFDPQPQGISLDKLAAAFAEVMGEKGEGEKDAGDRLPERLAEDSVETVAEAASNATASAVKPTKAEDSCPINPRTILEAMLFVGNRDSRPLSVARAAELMRDVSLNEIPSLVDELNRGYAVRGAPYRIQGQGDGYRLTLQREFHGLRDRFYGRVREARLSQAAIDVLALVAYQQPITGEKIGRLRGKPSSHVLAHLVRRGLLRIERPDPKRRTPHYCTTDRFLRLFNLESLDDLPQSEDAGPP